MIKVAGLLLDKKAWSARCRDEDFDKVAVPGIERALPNVPNGRVGKTNDNRTVVVRGRSGAKDQNGNDIPIVEIYNPETKKPDIKFRYRP